MKRPTLRCLAPARYPRALVAAALSLAMFASGAVVAGGQEDPGFLGFRINELRTYEMGPAEALNEGEFATWTIRLLGVDEDVGVFRVGHERRDPATPGLLPRMLRRNAQYEDAEYERVTGEIRLNGAGFPLRVDFSGELHFVGGGRVVRYTASYAFNGTDLDWDVRDVFGEVNDNLPLPDELDIHPELPTGLYVYYNDELNCLGRGTSLQWIADFANISEPCAPPDLLFANPGLLGLALQVARPSPEYAPDLWFLSPVATVFQRRDGRGPSGRSTLGTNDVVATDHLSRFRFETLGTTRLRIGERSVEATELYIAELARTVHVDDQGVLVSASLGFHPVSNAPRWIRLRPHLGQ